MSDIHHPVLLNETLAYWITDPNGIYIDATFGRGGHTQALLNKLGKNAQVIALDQDMTAVAYAKSHINDPRFCIEQASFSEISAIAARYQVVKKINGILLDIGVSSPQLDDAERGFSFLNDGPLDMRMNQQQKLDAKQWINTAKETDMAAVFKNYGEERFAKRIAHAITMARKEHEISRTLQLADIVTKANPKWERHKHPATRVFQAIRIHVNDELNVLQTTLKQCVELLQQGGRLVVISFHSLEDRIVKHFFREQAKGKVIPKGLIVKEDFLDKKLKLVSAAIKASDVEIKRNPRARSAILRVAEKL